MEGNETAPDSREASPRLPALNKHQLKVVNEAPQAYKGIMERGYSSKATAVKAFCLRCVGYLKAEVRGCTSYGCPLWPHRPYQEDEEASQDAANPQETHEISV